MNLVVFTIFMLSCFNQVVLSFKSINKLHKDIFTTSTTIRTMAKINDIIPSILVDVVESYDGVEYKMNSGIDFHTLLKSHNKAVLFAVPGAFTPTCSEKHLPGFIANANAMYAKGVDAIYCISVNDKYVMKAWGLSTLDFTKSGIKLVADGNCDLTNAMNISKDATSSRMGIRSIRYAAIVQNGIITNIEIDEKGLDKSSAETILSLL